MPTIDADCHVIETDKTWDYLDEGEIKKYRPTYVSATSKAFSGKEYVIIDGKAMPPPFGGNAQASASDSREVLSGRTQTTTAMRTMEDIEGRLRHMDELGVDVQVLYPSIFLGQLTPKPDMEAALCRSWNRWLADIWKHSDNRLRWTCMLPLLNMDEALDQMRYSKENGACGIFMRGFEGDRLLIDEYFYPMYETAQELDMPPCVHAGGGNPAYAELVKNEAWHKNKVPVMSAFHSLLNHQTMQVFPRLRFGFIEAAASWVPYMLIVLKRRLERDGKEHGPNPLKDNRMYVACQTNDDLEYIIQAAGDDNLVIGSDYGHSDTSSELEALKNLQRDSGLPPATVKKILEDNPRALYGI
jgi:predicted TIM-barrel fold metal-dependent hydrolase